MTSGEFPSLLYLWDKRTLYIGPLFEPLDLSQGAATLVLALDKPIVFKAQGVNRLFETRSLLLPAGLKIKIDTRNAIVVNCNLDAMGVDFFVLSRLMKNAFGDVLFNLRGEREFIRRCRKIYTSNMSSTEAYEYLDGLWSLDKQCDYSIDCRVEKVVSLIKQTVDDNLSVEDLANAVNLSVPRLVQLFKRQTGVPIRRYRLWHRLYITALRMGHGESLTSAAIAAGFTDSSHCSHTFRSMLGVKPSLILSQPNGIRIIPPNHCLMPETQLL